MVKNNINVKKNCRFNIVEILLLCYITLFFYGYISKCDLFNIVSINLNGNIFFQSQLKENLKNNLQKLDNNLKVYKKSINDTLFINYYFNIFTNMNINKKLYSLSYNFEVVYISLLIVSVIYSKSRKRYVQFAC